MGGKKRERKERKGGDEGGKGKEEGEGMGRREGKAGPPFLKS